LFSVSDGYRAGNGCFEFYGILVASLTGYVNVSIVKDQVFVYLEFIISLFLSIQTKPNL